MLNLIQPEICFLSTGGHGGFKHPREDVVKMVRSLKSIRTTPTYPISCFREENRLIKRIIYRTGKAIFSTFDHGLCRVVMHAGNEITPSVATTFSMGKTYTYKPPAFDASTHLFALNLHKMWRIRHEAFTEEKAEEEVEEETEAAEEHELDIKGYIATTLDCSTYDLMFWQKDADQCVVPYGATNAPTNASNSSPKAEATKPETGNKRKRAAKDDAETPHPQDLPEPFHAWHEDLTVYTPLNFSQSDMLQEQLLRRFNVLIQMKEDSLTFSLLDCVTFQNT